MSNKNVTEDYSERVNLGDEKYPTWVDRLTINKVDYGYSLFDRKIKKQLIARNSKENCEKGEMLLLEGKENEFKEFLNELKNDVNSENKIIAFMFTRGSKYFNFNSYEQLKRICLYVLKERIKYGQLKEIPMPHALDFTYDQIDNFPKTLRKIARENYDKWQKELKFITENNNTFYEAIKAIDENNGDIAWNIIQLRKEFGNESFAIFTPITI